MIREKGLSEKEMVVVNKGGPHAIKWCRKDITSVYANHNTNIDRNNSEPLIRTPKMTNPNTGWESEGRRSSRGGNDLEEWCYKEKRGPSEKRGSCEYKDISKKLRQRQFYAEHNTNINNKT